MPSPNPETIEALLDTTWRLAEAENARTEDLDRKATSLATFAALVVSLTATLGTAFLTGLHSVWTLATFAAGVGLLGSSVAAAVAVLLPNEHLTLSIGY